MATGKTRLNEEQRELVQKFGLSGEADQIPDEIAIVGTGPSMCALPKDNKLEVWGCNGACVDVDCDRIFLMDGIEPLKRKYPQFLEYLKTRWVPIYLPEAVPEIPCSVTFKAGSGPWQRIFAKFGVPWAGGTIAYMIAFAVFRGVKKIHMYGCDLYVKGFNDNEYAEQIPSINLWTGIAIGMGIQVLFPAQMVLSMPLAYGQHKGLSGTVQSDGTFIGNDGRRWIEMEMVTKKLGNMTIEEERPAGTHLGVGVDRKLLGLKPIED